MSAKPNARTRPPGPWGQWEWVETFPRFPFVHVVRGPGYPKAVLKELPPRDRKRPILRQRFTDEATATERIGPKPGLLPVFALDPRHSPEWFVMPMAEPICSHLGPEPRFVDVVDAIWQLAVTLESLRKTHGIAHRDIKPENLFWYSGRPVLGDLGIAVWTRSNRSVATFAGTKVGPANFIAPEMRSFDVKHDPHAADVYSLIKTLFVLARPEMGKYPPEGTHFAAADEFSLYSVGGRAAVELAYLIEASTAYRPIHRPHLQDICIELRLWLDKNRNSTFTRRRSGYRTFAWGDPSAAARAARFIQLEKLLVQRLEAIPLSDEAQGLPRGDWKMSTVGDLIYDGGHSPEDDWQPDAAEAISLEMTGRRLIIGGVLEGNDVEYVAELQTLNGALEEFELTDSMFRRAKMDWPSGEAELNGLIDRISDQFGLSADD